MELQGGFEVWKENELEVEEESTNRMRGSAERTAGRH